MPSWMVIITSTDPDTGESARDVFEVTPPPAPGSEHSVLVQLVTGIHPDAVEHSHDAGTVTFDDGRRRIAARFEIDGTAAPVPPPDGQGSLFEPF